MSEQRATDHLMEALTQWGCDVAGALPRFLNNRTFYETLLRRVPEETGFDQLGEALRAGDVKTAFEQAHTLKGVLGNMGLTPMYDTACAIVEPLRAGRSEGTAADYAALMEQKARLEAILREAEGGVRP